MILSKGGNFMEKKKYKGNLFSKKKRNNNSTNYVDNEKFYEALIEYLERKKENPDEKIPEFIGICLQKIAQKIASMPIFCGYPFREDLIAEAVFTSLKYLHCFNPEKSKNPFSYFTRVIYFSFLQIIKREKRYISIKNKAIMSLDVEKYIDLSYNSGEVENYLRSRLNDYFKVHGEYL